MGAKKWFFFTFIMCCSLLSYSQEYYSFNYYSDRFKIHKQKGFIIISDSCVYLLKLNRCVEKVDRIFEIDSKYDYDCQYSIGFKNVMNGISGSEGIPDGNPNANGGFTIFGQKEIIKGIDYDINISLYFDGVNNLWSYYCKPMKIKKKTVHSLPFLNSN